MQEEKSYLFDLGRQKKRNTGSTTESHLLCQLFFLRRDIPMGTHFCCANHSQISAGRFFLSGHERREDGRGRCKKGGRGRGSPGDDDT